MQPLDRFVAGTEPLARLLLTAVQRALFDPEQPRQVLGGKIIVRRN